MVKGPKGRPDTQTYWSTDYRPQEELQLQNKQSGSTNLVYYTRTRLEPH
jgi:hypothetical protein